MMLLVVGLCYPCWSLSVVLVGCRCYRFLPLSVVVVNVCCLCCSCHKCLLPLPFVAVKLIVALYVVCFFVVVGCCSLLSSFFVAVHCCH